jgi:hypothetical protein
VGGGLRQGMGRLAGHRRFSEAEVAGVLTLYYSRNRGA